MKRNKFYNNANSFYYRDKIYLDEPEPDIIIAIIDDDICKNKPTSTPVETTPEQPVETTPEQPVETTPEQPVETTPEQPVETTPEQPVENINYKQFPQQFIPQYPRHQQQFPQQQLPQQNNNPAVWGPKLWFSFHNGASKYPVNPSPIIKNNMKNFILGIPVMLPCEKCKEHANQYIESNYSKLDDIVSSRDKLFKFFVDFHNHVNRKTNKPEMSYEQAQKLYN